MADLPPLVRSILRNAPRLRLPRLIANLWGTTTLGDCAAILRLILMRDRLVDGPELAQYEQAFAAKIGVRYAVSFASGRIALYELLCAHGLGSGDEVLLQVPTHVVVANAVRYTGATPVFVDCSLDNYNMDLAAAEAAVTPRTKVLLVQHTFGIPVDMRAAKALADRHGLLLIEDCVHALGARFDGRPVGSFGVSAFFSTEETKTISSTMGGMAVTNDERIFERLRHFQNACAAPNPALVRRYLIKQAVYHLFSHPLVHHFTRPLYMALRKYQRLHLAPGPTGHDEASGGRPSGYEARLANGQAIIAMRQMSRLDSILAHRKKISELYCQLLAGSSLPIPRSPSGADPAYVRFPVPVPDRDQVMKEMASQVILGRWFDQVLEEVSDAAAVGYRAGSCPNAEYLAKHLVNLPTHLRTREKDVAGLVRSLVAAASIPAAS